MMVAAGLGRQRRIGLPRSLSFPAPTRMPLPQRLRIAKVGFGRKPALYPARAESRLFDMALKLSKMV